MPGFMSVADDMSGLGSARPVRLSEAFWRVLDAPEGSRGGCAHGKVFEPSAPLGVCGAQSERGGRVAGGERTEVPALDAGLRGGGGGWTLGRPARQGLGQAGSERPGGRSGAALSRAPPGFHRQAFPRASGEGPRLRLELHLAEAASSVEGRCRKGAAQRGAPEEARAAAPAGGDAASEPAPAKAGDGSRHAWLAGQPALDLIVTMDDATGSIYSAFLTEEEGTASTFRGLSETFGAQGLPLSLYTDRGSHYFHTPEADGKVDKSRLTQVGRALAHLGVEHIAAYSPQARGRSERLFLTLQDRLPKELALARIVTRETANVFLREVYIPAHNARFAVEAEQEGTTFVAIPGVDLNEILCVQEDRKVGNDNTVSYNRLKLQIPASPLRAHFVKANVKVREYPD